MAKLTLEKGKKLSLEKEDGSKLNTVRVELRWTNPAQVGNVDYDADASAIILGANGKALENTTHFCFYGQPETPFITSSGDDQGDGDDDVGAEDLIIQLSKIPEEGKQVPILVTLHKAISRRQNLAQLSNGTVTLIDNDTNSVLASGSLGTLLSSDISVLFVMLNRTTDGWNVELVNQGFDKDLADFCQLYNINLG